MDDKTFQAIQCLAEHPIEAFFFGDIWPVAAFLCMIADVENSPISADVRKIVLTHPLIIDRDPSTIESEAAEEQFLQNRAGMIHTLKTEIRKLYTRGKQDKEELELYQDGKASRKTKSKKSAAGGQPGDASKGGNL